MTTSPTGTPSERVVALAESEAGWDPTSWRELAELGWLDPELGLLEHAVLAEETGNALLPAPWWSTRGPGLAAARRRAARGDQRRRAQRRPWPGPSRTARPRCSTAAHRSATTRRRRWRADRQQDPGPGPDLGHRRRRRHRRRVCTPSTSRPTRTSSSRARRWTCTRRLGELQLDGTPARKLEASVDALTDVRRQALALLACEAVGVAQQALDLAAAYTKERQQFGRVIGTYQGVSHRVSNTFVALQLGALDGLLGGLGGQRRTTREADLAVAGAKVAAGEGAVFACEQSIQAHGGIGFT